MKLILDINKIDVLLTHNTDKVIIYVNKCSLPFPVMPNHQCNLNFECLKNTGKQYVIDNFGIIPNVINIRLDQ